MKKFLTWFSTDGIWHVWCLSVGVVTISLAVWAVVKIWVGIIGGKP